MKSRSLIILGGIVALNFAVSVYLLATRENNGPNASSAATDSAKVESLESAVGKLRADLRNIDRILGADNPPSPLPDDQGNEAAGLSERLAGVETALAKLEDAMDGISLESASEERDELFQSENGHLKADEYFEAGKFAIAGEGYLKFLESHPDHPDARNILDRARNSFLKAGYSDKAFWVQNEILKHFPENRAEDLWRLARMEKDSKSYADAAVHAAESAELLSNDDKYWRLLYAAWYAELAHGKEAGLTYYRDVQQQIVEAGYSDHRLTERAQEAIDALEQRIAESNP